MTDRDNTTWVLLRPEVTEEQVDDISLDLGWVPLGSHPATDTTPYERVWQDEVADVYVHFVWDDLLALALLLLHGRDLPKVQREVESMLPMYTLDEVLAELRSASEREPVIDAICRIAALRPKEDPGITELLRAAASGPDVEVRRAVITATSYLEWPALIDLIIHLRSHDPEQEVRDDAALVLDARAETGRRTDDGDVGVYD